MSNFAELKLVADTREMEKGNLVLDKVVKSSAKVERAVDKVGDQFVKTGAQAQGAANKIARSRDALGRFTQTGVSATIAANKLGTATGVTSKATNVLTTAAVGNAAATHKMAAAHGHASQSMLAMLPQLIVMAAAYAALAKLAGSITTAREFNAALAETSTLIEGTPEQMKLLTAESKRLAATYGGAVTDQVKAYYQAISAGAAEVNGLAGATRLLDQANKLAIGGVTNVTTAVDALTTATNVYRAEGLTAAEASDALFVSMKAGKTTVGELSGAIGNVLPIAQAAGVSFDEVAAAIAALTKGGINTTRSVTALRSILAQVLTPSEQAKAAAIDMKLEFNATALATKGLAGFMEDLVEKTGGSTEAIAKLMPSLEGLPAVLAFAGQGGQFLADNMEAMANKTGATQEAFEKISATLDERLNVVLGRLGVISANLGESLLIGLVPAMESLATSIEFVVENSDVLMATMTGMAATQIPALILGLGSMVKLLAFATKAATGLAVAVSIAGGPIGILIGVLAGAASYFLIFRDSAKSAADQIDLSAQSQRALNSSMVALSTTVGPDARDRIIEIARAYVIETQAKLASAQAEVDAARLRQQAGQALLDQNSITRGNLDAGGMGAAMATNIEIAQLAVDRLNAQLMRTIADLGKLEMAEPAKPLKEASREAAALAQNLSTASNEASRLSRFLSALPGELSSTEEQIAGLRAGIAALAGGGDEASASVSRYRAQLEASVGPLWKMQDGQREFVRDSIEKKVELYATEQRLTKEMGLQVAALNKIKTAGGGAKESLKKVKTASENLAGSISGTFGAGFRSIIDGTKTVSSAFRSMARDIIAQLFDVLVVQRLIGSVGTATTAGTGLAGLLGGIFTGKSYEGGGFTGSGLRSGGVDGRGGFPAILHPNETVIDHARGQSRGSPQQGGNIIIEQNLNFSTGVVQTVRAEIMSMMPQIAEVTKGAVLDARQRGGAFARGMGG